MNPQPTPLPARMDRRVAIKWMLTAAASVAMLELDVPAAEKAAVPGTVGYGQDPNLMKTYKPGDVWPLTLTADQRRTTTALCDVIIPAEGGTLAASGVGVPDFIDEWISAPYAGHEIDRGIVIEGLAWIDTEAQRRFQKNFAALADGQKNAICEDICFVPKAAPEFKAWAQFFKRFRDLTAGGFYTTREGMKDIGYVGNVPLATFDGPPAAVLSKLGLA